MHQGLALLIEARQIASLQPWNADTKHAANIAEGKADDCADMVCALAALKRGIEIGEARK